MLLARWKAKSTRVIILWIVASRPFLVESAKKSLEENIELALSHEASAGVLVLISLDTIGHEILDVVSEWNFNVAVRFIFNPFSRAFAENCDTSVLFKLSSSAALKLHWW
jgi:hypothetical protein